MNPATRKMFSSKLSRKGMVIIAIPIAFSLVLIIVLKLLLNEAQAQADREARSKEVIALANGLAGTIVTAISESYMSRLTGGGLQPLHTLQASKQSGLKKFEQLKAAVEPGSEQAELVDRVGVNLLKAFDVAEELNTRQPGVSKMELLTKLMQRRKELVNLFAEVISDGETLTAIEKRNQQSRPISQKSFRQFIDLVLIFGVAGDILLALYLMARFSSDITSRVDVLVDNSVKLIKEEPLKAPIKGDDEISGLDEAFHEMAAKLDDAKQRERAVLERLKSIIETIPLGIMIIDNQGKVMTLSPGAEKLFQYESEAGRGMPRPYKTSEFFTTKPEVSDDFLQSARKGAKNAEAKRADGSTFPCEIICTDYSTPTLQGRLLVITDISERHEMERLKQSFVSIVSHELRSPLTSLQVCLKMLLKNFFGPLNEEGISNVQLAETSVQRLVSLVNEILDVERLESGNISIAPRKTELQSVLELSTNSVNALAEEAGIKIEYENIDFEIDADESRLVQVVVNFLSNAIKFSPRGSKIRLTASKTDGDQIEVQVIDQGRGIPTDQRELVFKRFHQVEEGDAQEKGGAGLGLAICKAIIEAHNGTIGVDSNEGKGSIFWFKIPSKMNLSRQAAAKVRT